MANYVVLAHLTDQGIRAIKDTAKRAKAFRNAAKEMGANIKDIYWMLGQYDVILTLDAPDDETIASLMMKVGSLGNLKCQTARAFDETEIDALLSRM